jgi:cell division protein FtsI/penicillin-binding protein 2
MQHHPQIEFQRRERAVSHRMLLVACGLILGFTGISVRLWWVQVKQHEPLEAEAADLRHVRRDLPAQRGSVWDRNGSLLAQDLTLHDIYADTHHLADINVVRSRYAKLCGLNLKTLKLQRTDEEIVNGYRRIVAETLACRMGCDPNELLAMMTPEPGEPAEPIFLKDLNVEEAAAWRAFFDQNAITGVYTRKRIERFRPADDRMIHLLGLVTKEQLDKEGRLLPRKGAEGVEQLMDRTLSGTAGYEDVEMDATRARELPGYAGQVRPPVHGQHIVLTVDMPMQQMLEKTLLEAYRTHSPKKVVAVIVEPSSGSILAMASEPREQVNKLNETERRNMAVTDTYEPGSVMKILTITAAIESGACSLNTQFNCHGGEYREASTKVWLKDHGSYGSLSVKDILAHSSNIGAYMVAKATGRQAFYDGIKRFGLGEVTALGLPREQKGKIRPVEEWTSSSLSRLAMGYEVSATPLQMTMAVASIANGGKLMQPRLVERVLSADRSVCQTIDPVMVRQVCSPGTAAKVTEAMEFVVTNGTGKSGAIEGIRVAGKTGTAQLIDRATGKYSKVHRAVSFAGFAPVERPRLACLVLLEDPHAENTEDIYGGKISAPIFADIVKKALDIMAVAPERDLRLTLVPDPQGGGQ